MLRGGDFVVSIDRAFVVSAGGDTIESYKGTQLGQAVLSSALSPSEGLAVFAELRKARQCLVLENDLHIVYLVSNRAPAGRQIKTLPYAHISATIQQILTKFSAVVTYGLGKLVNLSSFAYE